MRVKLLFKIVIFVILLTWLGSCSDKKRPKTGFNKQDSLANTEEVKALSKQIEDEPENAELFYMRAQIYGNQKYLNRAEDDYKEAYKLDSTNALYAMSLGRNLYAMNQTLEAAKFYERALEIKPNYGEVMAKLADLYFVVKEHRKSIDLLTRLMKLDAGNAHVYHMLGLNYKEMGDTSRAIYHFQTAIENDPSDYESTLYIANLYAGKRKEIAFEYFKAAIKIKPKGVDAFFSRAVFEQQIKMYKAALLDYRRVIDLDPQSYLSYYNVGYINYENGFIDEAMRNWGICAQMNPDFSKVFYMRGLVFEEQKNKKDALVQYQVALDLEPENVLYLAGLKRVN
ncbi:MAG: tetratricopeptide repeat protein [bacterium]|nr:tetratricopeptide repeat protein [bacterium]